MTDPQNTADPGPPQEAPHPGVAQEHAVTEAPQVEAPAPQPSVIVCHLISSYVILCLLMSSYVN